ncbi:MAG: Rrf2 family transcriptional regulator [Rhodospirillales bacterium]
MHLSRHSDYSLRVLLYLAARPGERGTLSQIAGYFDISLEHLRKVVHELAKAGFIKTFQGKGGGMELALPPGQINLGEVLARLEGGAPLIDCAAISCRLAACCTLSTALGEAQRAFFDALAKYSLADLIDDKAMLRELIADK